MAGRAQRSGLAAHEKGLTLAEVIRRSEVLTVGLDGGGLDDFSACLCWAAKKERASGSLGSRLHLAGRLGAPQGEPTLYEDFIKDGDLTLVERLPDDVTAVVDIVKQCLDSGKLAKVGADPAGLGSIVDELAKIGVTQENELLVGVRQGVALMGAIKTVERKLADGSFKHGGRA
jgi:phage terminase large subunit-like protein